MSNTDRELRKKLSSMGFGERHIRNVKRGCDTDDDSEE